MTRKSLDPTEMANAVAARDSAYDGRFVYAVTTTRIFCRPSCASRRPRASNIRFFADAASAAASGFRACKRCAPELPKSGIARLEKIARFVEEHAGDALPLGLLAKKAGLSPAHFQKSFKAAFGVSPKAYQDGVRSGKLKSLLKNGDKVTSAIVEAGYSSTSRVYGEASRNIGMTPSRYRAGGKGEAISYACRTTCFGPLMMAATDRGVCFAMFGTSEPALLKLLEGEFPNAELSKSAANKDRRLDAWIDALDLHLSKRGPHPDLPLDLLGTAFQIIVWKFLLSIPEGDVIGYSALATGIGKPKAVRAAASACAANRIAVLVPCHRVLRGDGGIGGYRWGVPVKEALLRSERGKRG